MTLKYFSATLLLTVSVLFFADAAKASADNNTIAEIKLLQAEITQLNQQLLELSYGQPLLSDPYVSYIKNNGNYSDSLGSASAIGKELSLINLNTSDTDVMEGQ